MNKPHGNTGRRNAAKHDELARVFISTDAKHKARWVHEAQAEGKKLSVWITDRLNRSLET